MAGKYSLDWMRGAAGRMLAFSVMAMLAPPSAISETTTLDRGHPEEGRVLLAQARPTPRVQQRQRQETDKSETPAPDGKVADEKPATPPPPDAQTPKENPAVAPDDAPQQGENPTLPAPADAQAAQEKSPPAPAPEATPAEAKPQSPPPPEVVLEQKPATPPANVPSSQRKPPAPASPQVPAGDPAGDPAADPPNGSARPKNATSVEKPIDVNFDNVPLRTVVESIGVQLGKNFEFDPELLNQTVNVIGNKPVPPDLAYALLESLLASKDFVMLPTLNDNIIKIVKHTQGQHAEKLVITKSLDSPMNGFDNFAIHVVTIQYANANEMAQLLKSVGSAKSNIAVYDVTNTLIISDTSEGLRNMFTLLKELDVPGSETSMEIFTLKYTRAETLVTQLEQVLGTAEGGGGQPTRSSTVRQPTIRAARAAAASGVPGQSEPEVIGSREETLRMVAEERLNALIVIASATRMEQVRFLIDQLDTPTPFEQDNMHYVELLNADAEEVETALSAITGGTPRDSAGGGGGGGAGGGGGGGAPSGEVLAFEKSITITRYDATNSLLILASPQDFRKLKGMIANLDVPRRQVSVEAIIMEVTITDRFDLSVELAGLTGNDAFGLNNVARLATAIAGGPLALTGPGATIGIVDGTTQIPVPTGVDAGGRPTGIELQTIPNVPLLLRALETITDVEVLSQPNLLTMDNEESNIIVGQDVPTISTLSDTDDRTGFRSRGGVQRRQVGVKMKVTPQINEGDYVSMEIDVEVSAPVVSSVGIDVNQVGATFQISNVTNNVVLGDGQTGIIGGLLRESKDRTTSQTPGLGDVPLLGWLFRNKANARNKQNLVILLTPHIIKEGHDLQRITDFRMDEFYDHQIDVIFDKGGFIRKIKKKHNLRNDYNPTHRYKIDGPLRREFGRGGVDPSQ